MTDDLERTITIGQANDLVLIKAFGNPKPWIGEIEGTDTTYRYKRKFLGVRVPEQFHGPTIHLAVGRAALHAPRLLEIQAQSRGFYVLHWNATDRAALDAIDEMTLQELLSAKEYAQAIVSLEMRAHLEAQRAELQRQLAERHAFEELSKKEKNALKRAEARKQKLALILPSSPTRKINFEK